MQEVLGLYEVRLRSRYRIHVNLQSDLKDAIAVLGIEVIGAPN